MFLNLLLKSTYFWKFWPKFLHLKNDQDEWNTLYLFKKHTWNRCSCCNRGGRCCWNIFFALFISRICRANHKVTISVSAIKQLAIFDVKIIEKVTTLGCVCTSQLAYWYWSQIWKISYFIPLVNTTFFMVKL